MTDVAIDLGTVGIVIAAEARPHSDGAVALVEPAFTETLSTFTAQDYVIVDGRVLADSGLGAKVMTETGYDDHTVVTTPIDATTLFPEAYAHWVGGSAYQAYTGTLFRWWPIGSARGESDPRLSFFLGQDAGSGGLQYDPAGKYNGLLAPYQDDDYSYQGFGREIEKAAAVFPGGGYAKIDPEANFDSATLAVTFIPHPGELPYYGIFEAAQYAHTDSEVVIGDPLVLRWHHGQLRLFHEDRLVLTHESHRASAAPITLIVCMDAATDVGRLFALDENRTTRTFNTAGLETIALLGIFGGLGQGKTTNRYRYYAEMDVLDICIWDYAMDWPEMESVANQLALAYGVGV